MLFRRIADNIALLADFAGCVQGKLGSDYETVGAGMKVLNLWEVRVWKDLDGAVNRVDIVSLLGFGEVVVGTVGVVGTARGGG